MEQYFFDSQRKTIVAFSKLFTDVIVRRENSTNIDVPIIYANKQKFYQRINDNRSSQGITLPAISLFNTDIEYNLERQKSNLAKSILKVSKNDSDILYHIPNPSPVTMIFEVLIKSKYYFDHRYITETIIPRFQPTQHLLLNLIPEMNVQCSVPVTLTSIQNDFQTELDEDPNSVRSFETTLTFEVESFIFPPLTEKSIIKTIKSYGNDVLLTVENEYSHDELINSKLHTITDNATNLAAEINIAATTADRYNHFVIQDFTTEIGTYGDKFKITNEENEEFEYLFEYDNGELYSADQFVPDTLTLNKTNNIFIHIPFIKENKSMKLFVKTYHGDSYIKAEEIVPIYNSFNTRTLRDLYIQEKKSDSIVYIDNSVLFVRDSSGSSIDDILRVSSVNALSGSKTISIGLSTFTWEAEKFICGVSDENESELYIKTTTTQDEYEVFVDAVSKGTLTKASISLIRFDYDGTDWDVYVNDQTLSFTDSDFISPFICWNGTSIAQFDYIKGYTV